MVFVTHDQQEAVEMATHIALMHNGRILQYAPPQEFYTHPASYEVAEFFNWKNYLPAKKTGPQVMCDLGEFTFPASDLPDGPCVVCIRPEAARVITGGGAGSPSVEDALVAPGGMDAGGASSGGAGGAGSGAAADAGAESAGDSSAHGAFAARVFEGVVKDVVPLGPLSSVKVSTCGVDLEISLRSTDAAQVGEIQRFALDPKMIWPVAMPDSWLDIA